MSSIIINIFNKKTTPVWTLILEILNAQYCRQDNRQYFSNPQVSTHRVPTHGSFSADLKHGLPKLLNNKDFDPRFIHQFNCFNKNKNICVFKINLYLLEKNPLTWTCSLEVMSQETLLYLCLPIPLAKPIEGSVPPCRKKGLMEE